MPDSKYSRFRRSYKLLSHSPIYYFSLLFSRPVVSRDCSMLSLSVSHHLLKSAQAHVHCIGITIQQSHSLTPSSPSVLNLFLASGTFPMSQLFTSGDQNTGASASASVFPKYIQGWFPLRFTGLISLLSKGLSGVFSSTTVQRHQFFDFLPSLQSSSHYRTQPLGRR